MRQALVTKPSRRGAPSHPAPPPSPLPGGLSRAGALLRRLGLNGQPFSEQLSTKSEGERKSKQAEELPKALLSKWARWLLPRADSSRSLSKDSVSHSLSLTWRLLVSAIPLAPLKGTWIWFWQLFSGPHVRLIWMMWLLLGGLSRNIKIAWRMCVAGWSRLVWKQKPIQLWLVMVPGAAHRSYVSSAGCASTSSQDRHPEHKPTPGMAAERRHHSPAWGARVLILLCIIWQKRRKGGETWRSSLDQNIQPEGRPVVAFFSSPAMPARTAVPRCWSCYLSTGLSSSSRARLLDLEMKEGYVPAAAVSERWHRAAHPSTHKSPEGRNRRIFLS